MNSEKVRKIVKEMWYETFLDKVTIDIDESRASAERDVMFKLQDLGMVEKTSIGMKCPLPTSDDLYALTRKINSLKESVTKLEEEQVKFFKYYDELFEKIDKQFVKLESGKKN